LFNDTIPTKDEYRYNGSKGGDKWKAKVRHYWLSKCPQLLPLLNAVERSETPVTDEFMEGLISSGDAMCEMSMKELKTLDALIFGFLSTATFGDADDVMESVAELKGFEAWWAICRHIDSGRSIRLDALRRRMRKPAQIRSLSDVPQGVLRFSNLVREFVEAGGEKLPIESLKSDLYESLPSGLRDQLLWHTISPEMSWDKFKDHISATATRIMHYSHQSPVHLAEEERVGALLAELRSLGRSGDADVLAVAKRLCPN